MKLWWMQVLAVVVMAIFASSYPAPPQANHAVRGMSLVPQWHCLRYRKFDLVKRCRNYRAGRRY